MVGIKTQIEKLSTEYRNALGIRVFGSAGFPPSKGKVLCLDCGRALASPLGFKRHVLRSHANGSKRKYPEGKRDRSPNGTCIICGAFIYGKWVCAECVGRK